MQKCIYVLGAFPCFTQSRNHENRTKFHAKRQSTSTSFVSHSRQYIPLPSAIEDVFREDLAHFICLTLPRHEGLTSETVFGAELRWLTYLYTCQLTVLHALERSGLEGGVRVRDAQELTVHVVGARLAESRDAMKWEIFAARLPRLRRLNVVLIGPELRHGDRSRSLAERVTCLSLDGGNFVA